MEPSLLDDALLGKRGEEEWFYFLISHMDSISIIQQTRAFLSGWERWEGTFVTRDFFGEITFIYDLKARLFSIEVDGDGGLLKEQLMLKHYKKKIK